MARMEVEMHITFHRGRDGITAVEVEELDDFASIRFGRPYVFIGRESLATEWIMEIFVDPKDADSLGRAFQNAGSTLREYARKNPVFVAND